MNAAEAAPLVLAAIRAGEPIVEVALLEGPRAGARMLVREGDRTGSLGDPNLDAAAEAAGRDALRTGTASTLRLERGEADGGVAVFVEPHLPAAELLIVGAGHIAQPLSRIGASLGFAVTVLDDRPDFATRERFPDATRVVRADFSDPFAHAPLRPSSHLALVTRGHKYDYQVLAEVMRGEVEPAYIGMVGSQRRVRAAFEQLAREGVPTERLAKIHAPIGLDVGAETPAEIAVAIAAELVMARRGGAGGSLRDRHRVVARWVRGVD